MNDYQDNAALKVNSQRSGSDLRINSSDQNQEKSPQDKSFNIYRLGEVKYAKLHSSANRPLKAVPGGENNMKNLNFCPCCSLPSEEKNVLEPFSPCDDPDDFSNCGQGVVLYYSFLKFIIVVLLTASLCMGCVNLYFSFEYTRQLKKLCDDYFIHTPGDKTLKYCELYYSDSEESSTVKDSFFFQFSVVTAKYYRSIFYQYITDEEAQKSFEKTVVNMSRTNFGCCMFIFIFNLVYIYFLFNKINTADYLVFTVSDYSIFLYNLYDVHKKFLESSGNKELEEFKKFLENQVCGGISDQNLKINRIDICYKLKETMKLQAKYEKLEEEIWDIENKTLIKNAKAKDSNEKEEDPQDQNRQYEGNAIMPCLSCFDDDKGKTISELVKERDEIKKQIDEIIEKSKTDTENYFGGAAFVTFETVEQQEQFLKYIPSNSITLAFNFLKKIYYFLCGWTITEDNKYYRSYLVKDVKF